MIPRITQTIASIAISLAATVISLGGIASAGTVPAVTILSSVAQGLRAPTALTMDANGNMYVADPRNGGVVKFNAYGKQVKTFLVEGTPQGVAITANGNLLVSAGSFVAIIDANGTEIGRLGKGNGQFKESGGIAIDTAGYIYVVDSLDNCVQVFNAAGSPVTVAVAVAGKPTNSFGTAGTLAGQFSRPTSIAYEKISDRLVVADTVNGRLQAFATNGTYVKTIGSGPATGPLKFVYPQGVTFDYTKTVPEAVNRMYVVDSYQGNLQVIDPQLTSPTAPALYLSSIGSNGTSNGQLLVPSEATFDAQNNRLLVVNGFGNIAVFGIDGGTSPTDITPPALSIDPVAATVAIPNITISGTVEAGASMIAGANTSAVTGPVVFTSATNWKCDVTALAPGSNLITVTATDGAGNPASQSVSVNYLQSAPALAVDASVPGLTRTANIMITGTVDAGAAVTVTNTATGASGTASVTNSTWNYAVTLKEGTNSFAITANRPSSATATVYVSITLDTLPPFLQVSTLANGSYTNLQTQNITGLVSDPNLGTVTVNGQPVILAGNGSFSTTVILVPGANNIITSATDILGNTTSDSRTLNFDAGMPIITVSTPADNSYTNKSKIVINGTLDKEATVKVAGIPAIKDPANSLAWTAEVVLTAGLNTILIEATDLYNNTSGIKRSITLDTTAPELAIKDPAQDISTKSPNLTVSGSVTDNNSITMVSSINGIVKPVSVTNGAFSFNVDFNQEGTYPVTLMATDAAGNVTTATRTLIYDITPPALTVEPAAAAYPTKLSGTVETGASIVVKNGDTAIGNVAVNAPAWSADLTGINYDPANLTVMATDAAGNSTVKTLFFQFPDGDLDGDSRVTVADALRAIRIVVNGLNPTAQELAHGDIGPLLNGKPNPNGRIDLVDAILILRKAVGMTSW